MKLYTLRTYLVTGALGAALTAAAQTPPKTPPATPGLAAPAPAATDPNKVVLQVGDEKITASQFQTMLQAFPPQVQAAANGPQKRAFIDQFIQLKVVAKEAERQKLDQDPKVQQQLTIQRDNLLAGVLFQKLMNDTKVDEAAERKYYDAHKGEFEAAKARHILIRFKGSPVPLGPGKKDLTEQEALAKAEEIKKQLAAGKDFAELAKTESDDTGSGSNGGDLGEFARDAMVKEFSDAAFTQPVGQVSNPVKSQFGYHLIKVDSRESKPFDQVKDQIERKIRPDVVKQQIDDLQAKTKIVVDESFFGPAAKPTAQK